MISTLLLLDDINSGLGGTSSFSSLSLERNLTFPKRPLIPRRWRPEGCEMVWTLRSPTPLRPPLRMERKPRDLAEQAEEMEVRAGAVAYTPSSPSGSSSACSSSPWLFSLSWSCSESLPAESGTSRVLLLCSGDLLFPSLLLRIEKMFPGLRLPNSLNPFLIFPLGCDSDGGGSALSVCISIFCALSFCPSPSRKYSSPSGRKCNI